MGNLLTLLKAGSSSTIDIAVDFENAKPLPEEQSLFETAQNRLRESHLLTDKLRCYTGCGDAIRKAISTPNKDNEEAAWQSVCPAVEQLKEFYDFSSVLESLFVQLLQQLCGSNATDIKANLEKYQATANQLARLLTFALDFDDLKMSNPSIQNDFSYYRRTLSRLRTSPDHKAMLDAAVVKDELANKMSFFYAYPTPMLKTLVDKLTTVNSISVSNMTECFSLMVAVCYAAVSENRVTTEPLVYFCLRVMVACIILYDHVHERGAFVKESEINVKACIKLIQTSGGSHNDSLLNALRYTTKHLNDESTPKAVKSMLG